MPLMLKGLKIKSFLKKSKVKPLQQKSKVITLERINQTGLFIINPKGINKTGYSKKEYYNNKHEAILN
jgi:hypothetical protein